MIRRIERATSTIKISLVEQYRVIALDQLALSMWVSFSNCREGGPLSVGLNHKPMTECNYLYLFMYGIMTCSV